MIVQRSVVPANTLTTTAALMGAFGYDKTTDPQSCSIAADGSVSMSHIEVQLDNLVGGPTTVTAWLTWDSTGMELAQTVATSTIQTPPAAGATTAAAFFDFSGGSCHWRIPAGKALYLWLALDAGTADLVVGRLFFEV